MAAMNLRALEYALAVAATGHFGRAADRCGVSQPTLSAQLAKLESSLGVRLFERGSRKVTPTPAGRRVLIHAQRTLDAAGALKAAAGPEAGGWVGPLRLGVIATAGAYLMPHLLPVIGKTQPEAKLLIREGLTADLLRRLHDTELDAAILSRPIDDPGVTMTNLGIEAFVLAVPSKHPLATKRSVTAGDLAEYPLLLLEEGHCLRAQALDLCVTGSRRREPYQASSLESLRQMVAAGVGPTLLPQLATGPGMPRLKGMTLVPFREPRPTRALVLAWRQSSPLGPVFQELAGALRPVLDKVLKKPVA